MSSSFSYSFLIITSVALMHITAPVHACTCIGKERLTTETELNSVDLVIKGKVIGVSAFDYYDTIGLSYLGQTFDPKQSGYLIRHYKAFTFVIDKKFKSTKSMSDTIRIITGYGGGDCGYEFEVGKEYIVYAETWKEKAVTVRHRKHKVKRRLTENIIADKFYTDICRLTQETNSKELENLKRLTE